MRADGPLGAPLARAFVPLQAEAQCRAAPSFPHGGLGRGVPLPQSLSPLGCGAWGMRCLGAPSSGALLAPP